MAQYRKYIENIIQSPISNTDSHRTARNTANKTSRSKDKMRLHCVKSKQMFLTDTQASDYTKSSNDCGPSTNIQILNDTIKQLKRQNHQLKQQLLNLKSNSYFNINQDKLKDLISQNQQLKTQIISVKKKLDESIIQRDFLERFNKNLKTQCEQLTRQVLKLNKDSTPRIENERSPRNTFRNVDSQDNTSKKVEKFSVKYLEEIYKPRATHRSQESQEKLTYKPRQSTKSRQKEHQKIIKKSRSTSRVMQNQYFIGKGLRQDPKRPKRNKKPNDE